MIRGHIDHVSRSRVEGWIFCEDVALTGRTVLAFVDETCVGGGRVDVFRRDLLEAGLGDGVVGFGFPVMLEEVQDPRSLDIRLEGSTLRLAQGGACLAPRDRLGEDRRRQGREPESLAYMRARGWLDERQYEALRVLSLFGAHVQALRLDARGKTLEALSEEIALFAGELCELHLVRPIGIEIRDGVSPADLAPLRRELHAAFPFAPAVVGLWAPHRQRLGLVEGSHHDVGPDGAPAGAMVEYAFGERHLLLLDLDARHSFPSDETRFTAFVPMAGEAS